METGFGVFPACVKYSQMLLRAGNVQWLFYSQVPSALGNGFIFISGGECCYFTL
jgi:hypothetical protein